MRVILHGILADKFGREFEIATSVPADAIEGLSRQLDWPRDLPVDCVGYDSERKLRTPTDADEIHLMPSMYGGGGKFGRIIVGAALIAAGVVLAVVSPGTPWYAVALITTGASMMMEGIAQLFMKAPTIDKSVDPPASKYLGNSKNTVAIGTLMTMAWGRVKLAGQWLSIQVDSSDLVSTSFPATTS